MQILSRKIYKDCLRACVYKKKSSIFAGELNFNEN